MSRSTLFNTETPDLQDILANGRRYCVPPYQRNYSWKEEDWEELWEDLTELASSGGIHYMGAVVLLEEKDKEYTIIDGQQRLATLTILILAAIDLLLSTVTDTKAAEENKSRARLLEGSFVGSQHPTTLRTESKLRLNRQDDDFFRLNITQRRPPVSIRVLKDSEKLLWNCFVFYRERMRERFNGESFGPELAGFITDVVATRLQFIAIYVADGLNAYTVFETLNARGVELTETDLLKNYLLSLTHVSPSQMSDVLAQWDRITARVGGGSFPNFLRHHYNSHRQYVRQKELFKKIKRNVTDAQQVFSLLESLEKDSVWFEALHDSTSAFWRDYPDAEEHVRVLNIFDVSQYIPLILAAKDVLEPAELVKVLEYCAIVSVRFNGISQRSTHILEQVYNAAALQIRSLSKTRLTDVRKALAAVYIDDDEFKSNFSTVSIRPAGTTKKRVLYILTKLAQKAGDPDLHDTTTDATLEHILPLNPPQHWPGFEPEENHQRYLNRLGNLTLLEVKLNNRLGNADFAQKRTVYAQSRFSMTRSLVEHAEWTPEQVEVRQKQMAKDAVAIWRLPS